MNFKGRGEKISKKGRGKELYKSRDFAGGGKKRNYFSEVFVLEGEGGDFNVFTLNLDQGEKRGGGKGRKSCSVLNCQ